MFIRTGIPGKLAMGRCSLAIVVAMLCLFTGSAVAQPRGAASALMQGHAYRYGVVPMRGHRAASTKRLDLGGQLRYGGGVGGAGVITGTPRVYLVFWGSQWGSTAANNQGDVTLAGDPASAAPVLQEFVKGIGTNGEQWSGVMTQYCQGVSTGAQTCPAGAAHVAYPTGGALAGVWIDESSPAPAQATGHQIGLEAVSAATHFANTSQTSNANVQYVIVSPTGTHPDGFNTGSTQFCAWHDSTGDNTLSGGSVSSPYGQLAFTNLPYIPDAGTNCGKGFVNSGAAGSLDGVTIVEGHEYAETLTDPYPSTGWTDSAGNEDGDKCAWITSGQQGASQNVTFSTGSFAVQSTWGNDGNGGIGACETSHPTVN